MSQQATGSTMSGAALMMARSAWMRRTVGFVLCFCLWYAGSVENTMAANLTAAVPALFTTCLLFGRMCIILLLQEWMIARRTAEARLG